MILGNHEVFYNGMHFNIKEFCVKLCLRGTGIGSALLGEFEARLMLKKIDSIYLFTSKMDETENFYKKRGLETYDSMVMMGKDIAHVSSR